MSSVWASTSHSRVWSPDCVVAGAPAVAGWLFHAPLCSFQSAAMRRAWSVRPSVADAEWSRSVALISLQPGGSGGRSKWTSARSFPPACDATDRIESLPKLELAALCETQLSKSATTGRSLRPAQRCPPPPLGVSSDS
jgi:hypothetical protein